MIISYFILDSVSLTSPAGIQSPRDFDSETIPKQVISLPEQLQNLIMGRVAQAKTATKTRKIVIYICAADSQGLSECLTLNSTEK